MPLPGGGVKDHLPALIGDDQPGDLQTAELLHGIGNRGGIEYFQLGNLVRCKLAFFNHGSLALVENVLTGFGAVQIQNQQGDQCDEHIPQRVAKLGIGIPAGNRCFIF